VELVEVVTNTGLSGATAVRKFGFARASTSADQLWESHDIDAVLIATRHSSHADLVVKALHAGKAVFVEKPLALDRASLERVLQAVQESGNDRLMVGFNRRFSPLMTDLRKAFVSSGPQVLQYRVVAGPLEKSSWYLRTETEGSRFAGEGGHFIDLLSWWLGAEPVRVTATAAGMDADNLVATISFADGSVASLSYLTGGDARVPKEQLEISAAAGFASFDNFSGYEVWQGSRRRSKKGPLDKGQRSMLDAFVGAVAQGSSMPIALSSLIATTRATLAVQESSTVGSAVDLKTSALSDAGGSLALSGAR
jgi:predicted dehydrogenase